MRKATALAGALRGVYSQFATLNGCLDVAAQYLSTDCGLKDVLKEKIPEQQVCYQNCGEDICFYILACP